MLRVLSYVEGQTYLEYVWQAPHNAEALRGAHALLLLWREYLQQPPPKASCLAVRGV